MKKKSYPNTRYLHSKFVGVSSKTLLNVSNPYVHSYGILTSFSLKSVMIRVEVLYSCSTISLYLVLFEETPFSMIKSNVFLDDHLRAKLSQHCTSDVRWHLRLTLCPNCPGLFKRVHEIQSAINQIHKRFNIMYKKNVNQNVIMLSTVIKTSKLKKLFPPLTLQNTINHGFSRYVLNKRIALKCCFLIHYTLFWLCYMSPALLVFFYEGGVEKNF